MRIRSASWLLSSQVLTRVLSFPISIILARTIGAAGKGELTMVQLIATMSAAILNLGMPTAMSYLAAKGDANERDGIKVGLAVSVAGGALVLAAAVLLGPEVSRSLFKTTSTTLVLLGAIAVIPVLLSQILSSMLIGLGRARAASLLNVGVLVFELLAFVALWLLHGLTPTAAVLVWAVGVIGSAAVAIRISLATHTGNPAHGLAKTFNGAFKYAAAVWATGLFVLLANRQDVLLVGYFMDARAVGVYSVAVTFAELAWFIPSSVSGILMPKIASEPEGAAALATRVTRILWLVTVATAAAALLVAWPAIPALFGSAFRGAIIPLALILPGIVATAIAGPATAYLTGTGHPFDATKAIGVNFAVNVGANVLLIPRIGIAGAALASTISYSVSCALTLWYFTRRTGAKLSHLLVPRREDIRTIIELSKDVAGALSTRVLRSRDQHEDTAGVV
jgi:O-antigen/teichoic acid export membrane protein